jgi:hypothetical protein
MRNPDSLRIGDAERDAAIAALTRHFADGRLTKVEHEERVGQALAARTGYDLRRLFADLPRLSEPLPTRPPTYRVVQPIIASLAVVLGILMLVNLVPVFVAIFFAFIVTRVALGLWVRPRRATIDREPSWQHTAWRGGPWPGSWQGGSWRGGNF